jgi:hypothetical protein
MAKLANRVTENQVAFAIVQIAKTAPSGVASFSRCKREVPNHINLSAADRAGSLTRHNEAVWEQLIRNIKSHYNVPGNYLHEGYLKHVPRVGYEVTNSGRAKRTP